MENNFRFLIVAFFLSILPIAYYTTYCGKDIPACQGVSLQTILETKSAFSKKYKKIDLATCSLGTIEGIAEKLPLNKCRILDLRGNHLEDIGPLLQTSSETLEYLFLQNNKLKNFTKENLYSLYAKFPNLKQVNLRNNGIKKLRSLKRARRDLPFRIKLQKKTITIEDD